MVIKGLNYLQLCNLNPSEIEYQVIIVEDKKA